VSDQVDSGNVLGESSALTDARARLDFAVLGYNRHANLVELHRHAVEAFRVARASYEAGAAERASLRSAREAAALHRAAICLAIGVFVRLLRDSGSEPQQALIAVKRQFTLSVTVHTPDAPSLDASLLEQDAGTWAIKAYYDAA
jgi:hypothetical protein